MADDLVVKFDPLLYDVYDDGEFVCRLNKQLAW